jgi:hypothetical protein
MASIYDLYIINRLFIRGKVTRYCPFSYLLVRLPTLPPVSHAFQPNPIKNTITQLILVTSIFERIPELFDRLPPISISSQCDEDRPRT